MTIFWTPQASEELEESALWYESKEEDLGFEFIKEVERALHRALLAPESPRVFEAGCRRILLKRFPYSLIYRIQKKQLQIIAVMDQRQKPKHWHERTQ